MEEQKDNEEEKNQNRAGVVPQVRGNAVSVSTESEPAIEGDGRLVLSGLCSSSDGGQLVGLL